MSKRLYLALFLLSSLLPNCSSQNVATSDRLYTVQMWPRDISTSVTRDITGDYPIRIENGHGATLRIFRETELPSWENSIRVVTWPDRVLVPGRWRGEDVMDSGFQFVFVPEGDLADGWYAAQVNFDTIDTGGSTRRGIPYSTLPVVDGWTTTRFRVGSAPTVTVSGSVFSEEDNLGIDGSHFIFGCSETVFFERERLVLDALTVTADGEPLRCWDAVPEALGPRDVGPTRPFAGQQFECERTRVGARISMSLAPDFVGAGGKRFYDTDGHSPPRWEFIAGAAIGGAPSDAFFEATRAEAR